MPSILSEMANYLRADAAVAATFGGNIHNGRRPKDDGLLALTIERSGTERNYHLTGETDLVGAFIRLVLFGREVSPELLETENEKIRLLLSAFRGTWGQTKVESVRYLPTSGNVTRPVDASDYWQFRLSNLIQVNHKQQPITSGG